MAKVMRTTKGNTSSAMKKTTSRTMTKRTVSAKDDSKNKVEDVNKKDEVVIEKEVVNKSEEKETKIVSEKNKRNPEEYIDCRSVNVGKTYFVGPKSGIPYEFAFQGEVVGVEYRDIVTAVRQNSSIFTRPFLIIEDRDVIEEFPKLIELYDNMYSEGDIEKILTLPPYQIKKVAKTMPIGMKDALKSTAMTKIAAGSLDSINTIKALDEIFGTKMMLMTGLFNDEDVITDDDSDE